MHHPTDRITHTMAFVTPVVEHWLEREIAQWVHKPRFQVHSQYFASIYFCGFVCMYGWMDAYVGFDDTYIVINLTGRGD